MAASERARTDFVANASHELRTPIAAIIGFVETLSDRAAGDDAATRERFLGIMGTEARRMQQLVDDLISLSRIEADRYAPPDGTVDLAAMADNVARQITATGGAASGQILVEADAPGVQAVADAAQIEQVLYNLVGNALKYGRAGAPVRVGVADDNGMIRLTVVDQGEGIPARHLLRLTERFYRVDPGRSRARGGTGLGLAIVKNIVERHRGTLDFASVQGVGTTVTVRLPKASPSSSSSPSLSLS
jgi:two-component system phosphate regulon sensor histidine kinase PhoR